MVNTNEIINTIQRNKELESLKKELKEHKEASISLIADQRKRIAKETAEIRELKQEVKELQIKQEEQEERIEELEEEVQMEREEAEKALNTAMKWRKNQMAEVVLKHDAAMGKLEDRIDWLENNLLAKNQEIDWRNYLENKELPALPKKQKRLKKFKQLASKVKEKTKEKFQAFIVQKNK